MLCSKCNTLNIEINTICIECNEPFLSKKNIDDTTSGERNKNSLSKPRSYFEYSVSFFEVISNYTYLLFKMNTWKIIALLITILVTLKNTTFIFKKSIIPIIISFTMVFLLSNLFIFGLYLFVIILIILIKDKELLSKHSMSYNNDVLREVSAYHTYEYKWKDIKKVYVSSKSIYIKTKKIRAIILPKRIFSDFEFDRFVKFLLEKTKAA